MKNFQFRANTLFAILIMVSSEKGFEKPDFVKRSINPVQFTYSDKTELYISIPVSLFSKEAVYISKAGISEVA